MEENKVNIDKEEISEGDEAVKECCKILNSEEKTESDKETTASEETKEEEADKKSRKEKKQSKKETEELIKENEKLKEDLKELSDRFLRMAAEYDNFRRRSREEKDATYENAMADTVAALLPIIDNLERAAIYSDTEKIKEGLEMILKSKSSVFSKLGVEEVCKVGDTFDPNMHNAVMHIEDENFGENEVCEIFQQGYKKGKHIIRHAMVKTAN